MELVLVQQQLVAAFWCGRQKRKLGSRSSTRCFSTNQQVACPEFRYFCHLVAKERQHSLVGTWSDGQWTTHEAFHIRPQFCQNISVYCMYLLCMLYTHDILWCANPICAISLWSEYVTYVSMASTDVNPSIRPSVRPSIHVERVSFAFRPRPQKLEATSRMPLRPG